MKYYDVPFVRNPNDRCVPATIGMVLAYFMPGKKYTMPELETLCGYVEHTGTWQTQLMLSLAELGFSTHWIEAFDHPRFIQDPKGYLSSILDPEALEYQLTHTDLDLEVARMKQYLESGLPLERRPGTIEDIKRFLDDGWLVRLEVNGEPLSGRDKYEGHSVLVIGYDDDHVLLHNPDGIYGNKPNQPVDIPLLMKAWGATGGSYALYAFRKDMHQA